MKVDDMVEVRQSWHSEIWEKYWKGNLYEERGRIVEVIGYNNKIEGYRVKFPVINIPNEDGSSKEIENFIWAFRPNDIRLVSGELPIRVKRTYRTGKLLKSSQAAAYRLKEKGVKILEIAERFSASPRTIKHWLQQERQKRCKLPV